METVIPKKYVTENSGMTVLEFVSNSSSLDIEVKNETEICNQRVYKNKRLNYCTYYSKYWNPPLSCGPFKLVIPIANYDNFCYH